MPSPLLTLLAGLGHPHVLVVGDLMLDRYVWGDVPRISPEAPVPVFRADRSEDRLGGAASVAGLLTALGSRVTLVGVLGDDLSGGRCRELFQARGLDTALVLTVPGRPTTRKERYLGRADHKYPQQVLRVDYETEQALAPHLADQLAEACRAGLSDASIVLVSDYRKGVCTPALLQRLIPSARERGRRVLVDPSPVAADWHCYRGCHLLTPNRREAAQGARQPITDLDSAFGAAEVLRRQFDLEAGLVTLDREGIVRVDAEGQRQHYPARERQVYDITGAGDTVLAVLGLVLGAGHSLDEALSLAIVAAGIQVERVGVAPVTRQDLLVDLVAHPAGEREKLVPRAALPAALAPARAAGQRVVFTNGCFDLLHPGHIHLLQEARRQGDVLVVGLNADVSVRRLKGPDRPLQNERSRAQVLAALACVDFVCLFEEDTPEALVQTICPDVMVKGADYRPEQIAGWPFVQARGGRLHLVPLAEGQSTTALAARLQGRIQATDAGT